MSPSTDPRVAEFYAQTYDASVPDWPGEIEFYRRLASEVRHKEEGLLEIACGTGRVAIRLAQDGTHTVGLDLSPKMLEVAREKSKDIANIRWVQADMCTFELEETFGLVLIPGHAFQNLNTPQEQVACLQCIYHHLKPGRYLIIHLDHQNVENIGWLGSLVGEMGGVFEPAEQFQHAQTGYQIQAFRSWAYEPATQTAVCTTAWEAITTDGQVVDHWQTEPIRLHCVFRFEMEHLLARVGFLVENLYGDFFQNPLDDRSSNMIWIARKPDSTD
jgi:ubiquinone/menaquinone biosynthesis C-methylase UbiE